MGLFAWRRRQEREAASKEAASFPIAEPSPKLDTNTKPKRRGRLKQLSPPKENGQAQAD